MMFRLIILLLSLLLPQMALAIGAAEKTPYAEYSPIALGATCDGVTDDTDAINSGLATIASASKAALVIDGIHCVTNSANVTVPAGVAVIGRNGGQVTTTTTWVLKSNAKMLGLTIGGTASGFHSAVKLDYGTSGQIVSGNTISGGVALNVNVASNYVISGNTLSSTAGYSLYSDGSVNGVVTHNTLYPTGGSTIQFKAYTPLTGNLIANNVVHGDGAVLTGIIFLSQSTTTVDDNKIFNNYVENVAEEGISNDYTNRAYFGTVSSAYSGTGAINVAMDNSYVPVAKQTIVILSGTNAGQYASISAVNGGALTLSNSNIAATASGTPVAVETSVTRTQIRGNTVVNAGRNGIILYGGNFGSVIDGNTVTNSGYATHNQYNGLYPYAYTGIGVFEVSQPVAGESLMGSISITNNTMTGNNAPGLSVDIAKWSGTGGSYIYQPFNITQSNNTVN